MSNANAIVATACAQGERTEVRGTANERVLAARKVIELYFAAFSGYVPELHSESKRAGTLVWDLVVQRAFLARQISLAPPSDRGRRTTPLYELINHLVPTTDSIRIVSPPRTDHQRSRACYVVELSASDESIRDSLTEQIDVPEELAVIQAFFEYDMMPRLLSKAVARQAGLDASDYANRNDYERAIQISKYESW